MWKIVRGEKRILIVERDTYNQVIKTFISYIKRDLIRCDNHYLIDPDGLEKKIYDSKIGLL